MERIRLRRAGAEAALTTRGAQITSYIGPDGRQAIWQADPAVWPQYGPVLFPVCGAVRGGRLNIGGVSYPMTKHGFAAEADFAVARQTETEADLLLTPSPETRAQYPFDFALHVIYRLEESGFSCTLRAENHSDKTMPLCLGAHPAFTCPMEVGATFDDYQLVFEQPETGLSTLVHAGGLVGGEERLPLRDGRVLPLSHALIDPRDTLLFAGLNSRSVDLVHRRTGRGLRFRFFGMEVLAVWSMPCANADYLCLEPWHGLPGRVQDGDDFEQKPYVTLLQPGGAYAAGYAVQPVE